MTDKLGLILATIQQWGYVAIAIALFLEGSSIPFPGGITLAFAGYLVSRGQMQITVVCAVATAAYTAGSFLPYFWSKRAGKQALSFALAKLRLSSQDWGKVEGVYRRFGETAVLWSRPFFVGNYISYCAGLMGMGSLRYGLYTALGILPWTLANSLVGAFFGVNWHLGLKILQSYSTMAAIIVTVLTAMSLVGYTIRTRLWRQRPAWKGRSGS